MRPRITSPALVAASILLAACGSSLTEAEFERIGNSICRHTDAQALQVQAKAPFNEFQSIEQLERLVELAEAEHAQLDDLKEPDQLASAVAEYLVSRGFGIRLMKKGLEAAREVDFTAYERYRKRVATGQHRRAQFADRAGLSECSRAIPTAFDKG